jgi:hypothetical protein
MDGDQRGDGRLLLAGGVIALLSLTATGLLAALSANRLRYLVESGREADATVTGASVVVVGNHSVIAREQDAWLTEYAFSEADGTPRTGTATLDPADLPRHGAPLRVRYTPGPDGRSAPVGRYDGLGVWALAVSAVVFCVSAAVVARSVLWRLRVQPCQECVSCVRST